MRLRLLIFGAAVALGGCVITDDASSSRASATLKGGRMALDARGDPDGSGMAEIWVPVVLAPVCYRVNVSDIDPATQAHLHRVDGLGSGPLVAALEPPVDGESRGCFALGEREMLRLMRELKARPSDFYIDVHNTEFPAGALRGTLSANYPDVTGRGK